MPANPYRLLSALCLCLLPATAPAEEVFRDREFLGGFNLSAVTSASKPLEHGSILKLDDGAESAWRLAQWGTRHDLKGVSAKQLPDGTRILRNAGKSIKIYPGGLTGGGILLGVNGTAEYAGQVRREGEPWPHLLIEQQIPRGFRLAEVGALNFTVDFRVESCRNTPGQLVDPAKHTAQVSAYWTLQNKNAESPDHGEFIWFGVPLFDARHDVPPGHQAVDTAVDDGRFIYTIDGARFYKAPTGNGRWHSVKCDLVPLIREALAASQEKGHLAATRFEDLQATSFNLGWEVPGPYDCEIALKNLSLDRVAPGADTGKTASR